MAVTPHIPLGQIVMTRGVANFLTDPANLFIAASVPKWLRLHAHGECAHLDPEDQAANHRAVEQGGGYVLTAWPTGHPTQPKIWLITEHDGSVTTALFPEEY